MKCLEKEENLNMEENKVKSNKKGLILSIIATIFTITAIVLCILWGVMVKEHFELQATAEDFEGLGSIGIILVGLIFAVASLISAIVSLILNVVTIFKTNKPYKLIGIILCIYFFGGKDAKTDEEKLELFRVAKAHVGKSMTVIAFVTHIYLNCAQIITATSHRTGYLNRITFERFTR